jgi:hypothetical protein
MTLLLLLAGFLVATAVLVGGVVWHGLARRDHRCRVMTLARRCDTCAAVLEGYGHGGHVVCACGATSPHLFGSELLAWRADHLGEAWPDVPGAETAEPSRALAQLDGEDDAEDPEVAGALAALEAEAEAERRAIVRARRRPDPVTPQVLREAAALRDEAEGGAVPGDDQRNSSSSR